MTAIHCDNEFKTIFNQPSHTHQIKIYAVAAQLHIVKAGKNNRIIKERVQCAYHNCEHQNVPYSNVPNTILIFMIQESANKLNYFPAQYGRLQKECNLMIVKGFLIWKEKKDTELKLLKLKDLSIKTLKKIIQQSEQAIPGSRPQKIVV